MKFGDCSICITHFLLQHPQTLLRIYKIRLQSHCFFKFINCLIGHLFIFQDTPQVVMNLRIIRRRFRGFR